MTENMSPVDWSARSEEPMRDDDGVTVDAVSAMRLTHWHLTVSHMLL